MKRVLTFIAAVFVCISLFSQENPLWLRKSAISPDGTTIAFSYQGDIFTVPTSGGEARQITANAAYDSDPIWTPDGKQIVFSSVRELSKDIWIVFAQGGPAKRLTTYPGAETPLAVSEDGLVYFQANIQTDPAYDGFPGDPQVYTVSLKNGAVNLVSPITMSALSVNANGIIIYEDYKGYEDPLRKHHTSSVTRDIWKYLPKKGQFQKLTAFEGEDRNPVFTKDGREFYFLSEKGGNFNVWHAILNAPDALDQVTDLPTHPVRNLSISNNGVLAFSYNGELYTCIPGTQPVKVAITIRKDTNEREKILRNISDGARELAVSPNGKEIAIVAHGDVYVIAPEQKTTRRITNTPEQERGVSFGDEGRSLYYAAERDGEWAIWKTELAKKEDKYFTFSYETKESRFTKKGQTCFQPQVSPDGKWVAFLRDRTELVIKSTSGSKEKSLLKGINYSYQDGDQEFSWSPDSRYILVNYQANGGWNNTDIALISVDKGEVTNITRSGYSDGDFRWALGGKAMTWMSDKLGFRSHGSWGAEGDIFAMFFDPKALGEFVRSKEEESIAKLLAPEPAKDAKKDGKRDKKDKKDEKKDSAKVEAKPVELNLENLEDKTLRLTPFSGGYGDYYLTEDGKKLYFVRRGDKGRDLCCIDIKEREIKVVRPGAGGRLFPSKDGKTIYILGRGISKLNTAGDKIDPVVFSSEYDYQPAAERAYIFRHAWKQVNEKFYDKNIHGLDWEAMKANYEKFLPYITNNFDFQDMLSELLGELNGSHTGARYRPGSAINVGHLGVLFDTQAKGKGLTIAEVLPGSVLTVADPDIKAGDVILAVDGKAIEEGTQWYDALLNKAGERILVRVKKNKVKEPVDLFVTPTRTDGEALYKRWVRQREKMVEELSGGRIGYVHVEGMNSASFREVYSNALGKYRGCEALIVDTRHNGGGWLHDDLATFLSGKAYIDFRPRGQYIGTEPFNKWNKPSCVLIGEDNYSDACGFPYVYKTLGIGKLIGAPVPGTMTAVWWETQIDPTLIFGIPQVTSWGLAENRPLENLQIEPDILVYNTPETMLKGKDLQLEAAVAEMLLQIDANKKK